MITLRDRRRLLKACDRAALPPSAGPQTSRHDPKRPITLTCSGRSSRVIFQSRWDHRVVPQRTGLLKVARRCLYGQAAVATLVASAAGYAAYATAQDVREIGSPSLDGATARGFGIFAVCAGVLSAALFISARLAWRGGGYARLMAMGCQVIVAAWLGVAAHRFLSGGVVPTTLWVALILLTLGATFGLFSARGDAQPEQRSWDRWRSRPFLPPTHQPLD